MPAQELQECEDCGYTYDSTKYDTCPKCWDKFCEDSKIEKEMEELYGKDPLETLEG